MSKVRIRYWDYKIDEILMGTLLRETTLYYVVIPDYNLLMEARWYKGDCEIINNKTT